MDPTPPSRRGSGRWPGAALAWLLGALAAGTAVYLWASPIPWKGATSRTANDYYAWLSDAFLSGQLYLKIEPDPRLNALANPALVKPGDQIPRLSQASYYRGHYYLYFSALPALLVFIPWRLIFGTFPVDGVGILLFAWLGWIFATATLWWAWRRWYAGLSGIWLALGVLLMALGTTLVLLIQSPMTHGVPISCAFCCAMGAVAALAWTLTRTRSAPRALGLALTSLAWGLAVAARPNYLASLPALVIPLLYLAVVTAREGAGRWRRLATLVLATVVPAALVGAGLAAYNFARFGNALDFGIYEYVGARQLHQAPFALANVGPNLRAFVLAVPSPPFFSRYFPFFPAWRQFWGALWFTPFVSLVLAAPVLLLVRRRRTDPVWSVLGLTVLAAFLLNLLSILTVTLLVGVAERYVADFLPLGVLLGVLVLWTLLRDPPPARHAWVRRSLRAALAVLLAASLAQAGLVLLLRRDAAQPSPALARWADRLVYRLERWRGFQPGALAVRADFPAGVAGRREPLLVTARGRDVLYVEYRGGDRIQFGFVHTGADARVGEPVAVTPGRDYELTVDLGSLYPPREHPLMAELTDAQADALLRRVRVTLDGRMVLQADSAFYPTSPGDLLVGVDPYPDVAPGRFTGRLQVLGRRGIPAPASLQGPPGDGPVHLTVIFPPFRAYHTEPLVSTGHFGAGDLLYVTYVAPGKLRFGHDDSGGGSVETPEVDYNPDRPHLLDVDMGSLHADRTQATFDAPLVIDFDEHRLIERPRQFHTTVPIEVVFGFNGMKSSVSDAMFAGRIVDVSRPGHLPSHSDLLVAAGRGAIRIKLRFPPFGIPRQEPLLVTGEPGAADVIYVAYVGAGEIRLGYDHWGTGGPVSAPLAINDRLPHIVEISLGSLYPALESTDWGDTPEPVRRRVLGTVEVKLDGRTVISHRGAAYPAIAGRAVIGWNTVGASTAVGQFTGNILAHEFLGLPGRDDQR